MTARIVSPGVGDGRALVVAYLVGHHLDEELRAALPGACIVAYDDAAGEPLAETQARARVAGWRRGPIALVGYSAGCGRGVREQLRLGARPDVVVAIDGTHASRPAEAWQIGVWREVVEDARAGRRLFVATHTRLTYVEHLQPPATPYQSTLATLRQVTGWPLSEAGPLPLGYETSFGDAHVHSYESGPADSQAHADQQRVVLPAMLRRYVAPWLAARAGAGSARSITPTPATVPAAAPRTLRRGDRGHDVAEWQHRMHELAFDPGAIDGDFGRVTEAATKAFQRSAGLDADGAVGSLTRAASDRAPSIPPPRPTYDRAPPDLGAALIAVAREELVAGVREDLGPNDGSRIRDYFAGTGAEPPANWCAAFVRHCLRTAAARVGVHPPIAGSLGAQATMTQLQRVKRWVPAEELRRNPARLRPGMIVVWDRSDPDRPERAWWGHIGIISAVLNDGRYRSLEGNSGDRVAENAHALSDPRLLGAGFVD